MTRSTRVTEAEIVARAQTAAGLSQEAFARSVGASRRTFTRWIARQSTPTPGELEAMIRLVYPRDPSVAAWMAEAVGETLESLGIVAPAPAVEAAPAPPARAILPSQLVDGVVCAAAEAMDLSPRAVRPALLAAFARARDLGLSLDDVVATLSPPPPPTA